MRVAPCIVAVLVCLAPAGCRTLGKKPAGGTPPPPPGADPSLRAQTSPGLPPLDRAGPPPGSSAMLAGQVIDYSAQRTPAALIQVAEFAPAGAPTAAPIEVPADNQGYFTIQGLQVGRRYLLTARTASGVRRFTGKTWATAPDPKVVIRLTEEAAPAPQPAAAPAPATGQRRPAELGPPRGATPGPPPEAPYRSPPRAEFRPDKTAWDQALAHNEPPKVEIPPWAPRNPPVESMQPEPTRPIPVEPEFGPARVPSCILTGDTLHNFALNGADGQPWEFRGHRGRLVLIDFWGTWCPHCLHAIPHLNALQDRYGPNGLEVIGIAYEEGSPAEQAQKVNRARQRLGIRYRVLLANDTAGSPCPVKAQFGVSQFPTAVLLNERGRIIWRSEGMTPPQQRELDVIIRQQLAMR